jgi:lipopolysaccharide assembly protein A
MQIGVIFGLFFGLIIAFFAVLNTETVSLNYYFGSVDASVALLVLASAICGALAIGVLSFVKQLRAGFAIWDFSNKSKRLAKEVESLKNQKNALADDLAFLQAEYESTLRQKEAECEHLVKEKKEELESFKSGESLSQETETQGAIDEQSGENNKSE